MRKLSLVAGAIAATVCALSAASAMAEVKPNQKFGDWTANCEGDGAKRICHIAQAPTTKEDKRTMLAVVVAMVQQQDGKKAPQMTIIAPLGTLLVPGLNLQIDDDKPNRVPFVQCAQPGCRTTLTLDQTGVQSFKSGKTFKVSYVMPNGQSITIPVSLNGFSAGLDGLSK